MRLRVLLSGALAAMPLAAGSPVATGAIERDSPVPAQSEEAPRHCVVTAVRTPTGLVADDSTMICYDTLAEMTKQRHTRSVITVATHYELPRGAGDTYTIQSRGRSKRYRSTTTSR
jgi:hypothetical protein